MLLNISDELSALFEQVTISAKLCFASFLNKEEAKEIVGLNASGHNMIVLDNALDSVIINAIKKCKFDCTIISEESGEHRLNDVSDITVLLDPLDGSNNYKIDLPVYTLSLAIFKNNVLHAGLLYHYVSGDIMIAEKGKGAWKNSKPAMVSNITRPENGAILTSRPFNKIESKFYTDMILSTKRIRVTGCSSYDIAMVGIGNAIAAVDIHIPVGLIRAHDVAAASIFLSEAGGGLYNEMGDLLVLSPYESKPFNIIAVNCEQTLDSVMKLFWGNDRPTN